MEIVFVHFGSKFPKHLVLNLKRTCDLFPNLVVVLISDRTENLEINRDNFRRSIFTMDDDYEFLEQSLSHPKDFRHNFWFTSLARIFALCDYVISTKKPIVHIESDVLVSNDLPMNRFAMCDRPIAFTVVGRQSGVASILWLESAQAAIHLRDYAMASALNDPTTTDMKILGRYQEEFPQFVRVLASFPTEVVNSNNYLPPKIFEDFSYTNSLFEGFFDAADVGRYLFGDDPRNHRGIKLLRQQLETSYLSPSKVRYVYSKDRNFLNTASDPQNRFLSLHIHSKNIELFREKRIPELFLRAVKDQDKPGSRVLVLSILIQSIKNSLIRRLRVVIAGKK
jgi:hypothetical protein